MGLMCNLVLSVEEMYIDGMEVSEIAAELEIPESMVVEIVNDLETYMV